MPDGYPAAFEEYLKKLYLTVDRLYREAGMPFGESDDAMALWYAYDQCTTRN